MVPRSIAPGAPPIPAADPELDPWALALNRVLVVEDSPDYALLVRELLRGALGGGVAVAETRSLAGALREVAHPGEVDCVLFDLSLPDASGLDGLGELLEAAPGVPVVVLSGRDDEDLAVTAVQRGAQDYLVKRDADERLLGRAIRYAVERKRTELHLAHLALHDGLTGLPNRALLMDRLGLALSRMPRHGGTVAVLFCDLDRFKVVNDSLGHAAGDELLLGVADRLRAVVRPHDTVARFGGDEFLVLCEGLEREATALGIARRLVDEIARPFEVGGREVFVGLSVGIAFGRPGESPQDLVRGADQTMYRAKRGREAIAVFEPQMHAEALRELELDTDLHSALARDELELRYQPLVTLADGGIFAVEALLRWRHPRHGLLEPAAFLPRAEATGLMTAIGRWVLHEACAQLARWRQDGGGAGALRMSVNLSPVQLTDPELPATLRAALAGAGIEPGDLSLELTEAVLADDAAPVQEALAAIAELGVRLTIDDFASGDSRLRALERHRIDALKVDCSLADARAGSPRRREVLAAILAMARALGTAVVAEGVEDAVSAEALQGLDCEAAQGFHFGCPQTAAAIGELLATKGDR